METVVESVIEIFDIYLKTISTCFKCSAEAQILSLALTCVHVSRSQHHQPLLHLTDVRYKYIIRFEFIFEDYFPGTQSSQTVYSFQFGQQQNGCATDKKG